MPNLLKSLLSKLGTEVAGRAVSWLMSKLRSLGRQQPPKRRHRDGHFWDSAAAVCRPPQPVRCMLCGVSMADAAALEPCAGPPPRRPRATA